MQKFGIDISTWQGNFNMNLAKSEGAEFIIIKGGGGDDGYYVDSRFNANYQKAKALGLPVGVYWFSKALNVTQAKAEAEYFYTDCLKGKQFELPVYIDVENRAQLAIGKRALTDVIKAWCDYLEGKGYFVGIYSSAYFFSAYMYDDELTKYAHWIAQWSTKKPEHPACGLWQFGGETNYIRSNQVAGQVVDQDYLLVDYETKIKKDGLNGFGKGTVTTPVTETPSKGKLDVDGVLGSKSISALQKWLGTYEDGVISGQSKALYHYYPAIKSVEFNGGGSQVVEALQRYLIGKGYSVGSMGADGSLGYYTVKALQRYLVKQGYDVGVSGADGYLGNATAQALQQFLNDRL